MSNSRLVSRLAAVPFSFLLQGQADRNDGRAQHLTQTSRGKQDSLCIIIMAVYSTADGSQLMMPGQMFELLISAPVT